MDLLSIFINIGLLLLFFNTAIYFQRFRQLMKPLKILAIYFLLILILQIVTRILSVNKIDNLFLSHYYFVIQFVLLSLFYRKIIENQAYKKAIVIITYVVVTLIILQYFFQPESYHKFNLAEIIACSLPIILHSVVFFFQNIAKVKKEFVYITSGIFLYLLCSTLIFVAGNYIPKIETFWYQFIWVMNAFLYIVYQFLISIEWYKNFRKKSTHKLNTN